MMRMRSIAVVLIILLILSVVLASCDIDLGLEDLIHKHEFADATCTAPRTCECGETEGEALGHTVVIDECVLSTCNKPGLTEGSHCSVCNEVIVKQEEISMMSHNFVSVVTDPTCTEKGYTTYTCSGCGYSYVADEVPVKHNYNAVVTDPTCTSKGYTTYTCADCGDSYVGDEVAMKDHSYSSVVTDPTCTSKGYTTYTCGVCGHSYVGDEVDMKDHSYSSAVTAPTCTANGYTTYTCGVCGDTYNGDIVIAKHSYDANGTCTVCGGEIATVVPVEDKAYIFGMYQGNKQQVYYLKGGMSGYYMATTTNPAEALFVYLEKTEGGYYAYCFVGGAKTYINMVVSGTHVNGAYESTASTVYTIDAEHHTLIGKVNGSDYWFATRNDNTYTTMGPCLVSYNGFYGEFYDAHTHNFVEGETFAPTCTSDGYTSFKCECGAEEKRNVIATEGHTEGEWTEVTPATCTQTGLKNVSCLTCGEVVASEEIPVTDHNFVEGKCECGAEDPNYEAHEHNYTAEVTAPTCQAGGFTTYTCACGDTYTADEVDPIPHVDENLDITCDYDGCSKRILPAGDSKISLFTANNMIIVSLSSSYYVEGVVTEITDAKNGIFVIQDEAGDTILVRLPKNAEGVSYSAWTIGKVIVGDTVQVYGKPTRNTGTPTTQAAKIEGGVLTVLKHDHAFSEADCTDDAVCACGATGTLALGHIDETADKICDRCGWDMTLKSDFIAVSTTVDKTGGVLDEAKTKWVWSNGTFDVEIAKGASTVTLYTNAKDYMQLKKQNTLTVYNTTGAVIKEVVIYTTNDTQLANLEKALANQDLTFTSDKVGLCVTITLGTATDFTITNNGTTTAYVSGVEIVYVPATTEG